MPTPEDEFSPGANRVEAEISHCMHDAETKNWNELNSDLNELARELDTALAAMSLTDENKVDYEAKLTALERLVKSEPDFEQREDIMTAIKKMAFELGKHLGEFQKS